MLTFTAGSFRSEFHSVIKPVTVPVTRILHYISNKFEVSAAFWFQVNRRHVTVGPTEGQVQCSMRPPGLHNKHVTCWKMKHTNIKSFTTRKQCGHKENVQCQLLLYTPTNSLIVIYAGHFSTTHTLTQTWLSHKWLVTYPTHSTWDFMLIPQNRLMLLGHPVAKILGNIYILHNNSHTIKLISSWYNITKRVWLSDNLPCLTVLCRALCGENILKTVDNYYSDVNQSRTHRVRTVDHFDNVLHLDLIVVWVESHRTQWVFLLCYWSLLHYHQLITDIQTHTHIHTDIVIETQRRYMPLIGGSLTFLLLQHDWLAEVSQSCGYHG